jgi:hypothetical protein
MRKLLLIFLSIYCSISFAQVRIRGPYLQSLTPSSVKILWRTDVNGDSKVLYGTSPTSLDKEVFIHDTVSNHIVKIDNLNPSTQYYYAIATQGILLAGNDSAHRFTTPPLSGDTSLMRIWVTGDFGAGNEEQRQVRQTFQRYYDDNPVNFWLWLGDNVYDDGKDFEYQQKVFDSYYGYDSLFRFLPFYPCPGNHDYNSVYNRDRDPSIHRGPYYDLVETFRNGEGGGEPSGAEAYYSFDWGNAHFISLNSELIQYIGDKNSVMAKWLKRDLENTDKTWKIAYWHQPPYSKGSHDSDAAWELIMQGMRENYVPILESYGVDLVLCGHSHVYERSYLLKGHYGKSGQLKPYMIKDSTDGNPDHGHTYLKYTYGVIQDTGTVYAVVGNSGKHEDANGKMHPAMVYKYEGSGNSGCMILEIEGLTLTGKYMDKYGNWLDKFIIQKLKDTSTPIHSNSIAQIQVSPNPVTNQLQLQYSLYKDSDIYLYITDIQGSILWSKDLGRVSATQSHTLQVEDAVIEKLAKQSYYLLLHTAEGNIALPFCKQ